jgi:Uma2 family endonuclease
VLALPDDGNRHELIDGELLVTPAPSWRHQDAVMALYQRLVPLLRQHRAGHVVVAPADIPLDSQTLVQPDLFVVPLIDGRKPQDWAEAGSLLLVVEILSPSSARADRIVKLRRYQRANVPEYWIVDLDGRVIERWRHGQERPEILSDRLVWTPAEGVSVQLDIASYFDEVWGE